MTCLVKYYACFNIYADNNVFISFIAIVGSSPVLTIDKLMEDGYKAIFIGTGVWNPKPLRIKGESLGHSCLQKRF